MATSPFRVPERVLLVGLGDANHAAAEALARRGHTVVLADDHPDAGARRRANALGIALAEAPTVDGYRRLLEGVDLVVPAPGLPDRHPVFALTADMGVPAATELDLAGAWDSRPVAAITGTNGKTSVTTMVAQMLNLGGIRAVEAGNNDLPLVRAIDDPAIQWFVLEASSFRLGRTQRWAPRIGTWLNLAPDHLDVHASHGAYVGAKARIWASQSPDDVAIGNLDDQVVAAHLARAPGRRVTFSAVRPDADFHLEPGRLVGPSGPIIDVVDLPRALNHDIVNALAAAATADAAGTPLEAVSTVLRTFTPLRHRVSPVATIDGVTYYDDSKATVPHATMAAVRSFARVVLIAGGRNKGLDLTVLAEVADRLGGVVAIGEAAPELVAVFGALLPVETASSMAEAVSAARRLAGPGDVVLLSPACASFDQYPNYAARGDDFAAEVLAMEETER